MSPQSHGMMWSVQVHDLVQVRPGSAIPADGVMEAGTTSGEEVMLPAAGRLRKKGKRKTGQVVLLYNTMV